MRTIGILPIRSHKKIQFVTYLLIANIKITFIPFYRFQFKIYLLSEDIYFIETQIVL